nr:Chain P, decamer from polymerase II C-terminal [synthetic construct]
TLMTGQLGLF